MLRSCARCSIVELSHLCRGFATSQASSSSFGDRKAPPARDWGSFKPAARPARSSQSEWPARDGSDRRAGGGNFENRGAGGDRAPLSRNGGQGNVPPRRAAANPGKWGLASSPRDGASRQTYERDEGSRSYAPRQDRQPNDRPARVSREDTATAPRVRNYGPSEPLTAEGDDASGERGGRRGRSDKHAKGSRSLIHGDGAAAELPGFRHRRSTKDVPDFKTRVQKTQRSKKEKDKEPKEIFIAGPVTVGQLAKACGKKLFAVQKMASRLGMSEDQQRSDYLLTADEASSIALEFDLIPVVDEDKAFDIYPEEDTSTVHASPRPPVVTIMGHVDHGKTTLLDSLRHTSVASGEAGGITQHIGAFSVPLSAMVSGDEYAKSDATITFLDTPGHAAFTAMRARGASVTDIVVLVVAADDGVMPQTKEVLELVKVEGDKVGLVIAINKCDKPGVDFSKVKSALGAEGILLEEDGGDIPGVKVSGLKGTGLDNLVETLSTVAEMRDLKARRDGKAEGYVLEARVEKGRGNVATVLVTKGTLRTGASIVAGTTWCRVRQMQDDRGKAIREALPGAPVTVTGWKDVPHAGDELLEAVGGEGDAKKAITNRLRNLERQKLAIDVERINEKRKEERLRTEKEEEEAAVIEAAGGNVAQAQAITAKKAAKEEAEHGFKELRLVIKADVSGTVEAVCGSLEGIGNKEAGVKIIHTGVGDVTESDVALAEAAEGMVIGFSVNASRSLQSQAALKSVPIHLESVIYRLIDTVRNKVAELLPPTIETRVTGEALVQQIFSIKVGRGSVAVAGCRVGNGVISKQDSVRVLRGPERTVVHEGKLDTLKHVKTDVTEVRKGTQCGLSIHSFNDIQEGDEIVTFTSFEKPREL